jgi:ATP-dependent RNA helicase DeaD
MTTTKKSPSLLFSDFSISKETQKAIEDMGFIEASPIQKEAIPLLLKGGDLVGQAQTGTGKTAAFGIPLIESITEDDKEITGIVLCPTRELALQVSVELGKISKYKKFIQILAVFGGDPIQKQIFSLKKESVNIVVGTPGRVMDLVDRKILKLDSIKIAILDEADEMLNMGFRDEIETLLSKMPTNRQSVLFSATMPKPILDIANRFLKNPSHAKVTRTELTAASIQQNYYEIREADKPWLVRNLIRYHNLKAVILFCNTKRKVDDVVKALSVAGIPADAIHGDLNQNQRNQVLDSFRRGETSVLVATDVAARGISVNEVDGVFNFDLPMDSENYVHRIGRTGRAGNSGIAFSFVSSSGELRKLRGIERYTHVTIERKLCPNSRDLKESYQRQIKELYESKKGSKDFSHYKSMMEQLEQEGISPIDLGAILISLQFPLESKQDIPFSIQESSPGRGRRDNRGNDRGGDRGPRRGGGGFRDRKFGKGSSSSKEGSSQRSFPGKKKRA